MKAISGRMSYGTTGRFWQNLRMVASGRAGNAGSEPGASILDCCCVVYVLQDTGQPILFPCLCPCFAGS